MALSNTERKHKVEVVDQITGRTRCLECGGEWFNTLKLDGNFDGAWWICPHCKR